MVWILIGIAIVVVAAAVWMYATHKEEELPYSKMRPIPLPTYEKVSVPKVEGWKVDLAGRVGSKVADMVVFIKYVDYEGRQSARRITIQNVHHGYNGNDVAIEAFCHEKRAQRTFLVSRIQQAFDVETGKQIDLLGTLLELYGQTDEGKVDAVINQYESEIFGLVFIGRVDGRLTKKEKEEIVKYLRERLGAEINEDLLMKAVGFIHCDITEFNKRLKELRGLPDDIKRRFIDAAEAVARATGGIDAMEAAALEKLETYIFKKPHTLGKP
jgi:cbb3-type cytochrome oxidase subunit 3